MFGRATIPLLGALLLFALIFPLLNQAMSRTRTIKTSKLKLEIVEKPFQLIFKDASGKLLTEGITSSSHKAALLGVKIGDQWERIQWVSGFTKERNHYLLKGITDSHRLIDIKITPRDFRIKIEMAGDSQIEAIGYGFRAFPDEHYSGMGQRFNRLNLRGQEIPTYDQPWTVPIPFFMSNRGYGIFVNSDSKFVFDFCTRDSSAYSFWVYEPRIEMHFIYGPSYKEMISQYTAMTGRMMKPPDWQFGVWKWRDWVFDETEVYEDASMLRALDIPASVILIDSPWSNEYIDYEFNPKQFPNPRQMIDRLHKMGYRVVLWVVPFVNPASKNFKEADEKGYFVKDSTGKTYMIKWWKPSGSEEMGLTTDGRGGLIDFTNPDAVKWWQNQVAKVVDMGVDGFKLDDGEHLPEDAYLFNGKRGYQVKNYPLLYHKAVYDLMRRKRKGNFVLLPRAGYIGSQKYVPAFWAADQTPDFSPYRGLPTVILGGQSIGLVGFPFWGSDVGGYTAAPTKEVFARWIEFGAFCPIMEVGGKSYHEPWFFDDELEQIFRRYAQLHTYLFPYIKYYVNIALKEGLPIIRPLFVEFQNDPQAYQEEFEYMFGEDLLVAPIYQPGCTRSVYLPAGEWMDFWSLEKIKGPQTIASYYAPLDIIPLFVRVSPHAIPRLLKPLFREEIQGLAQRVQFYLRGKKKYLHIKPARALQNQLDQFLKSVPGNPDSLGAREFIRLQGAIRKFKRFLKEGEVSGTIPFHVFQTLSERLRAIEHTAKALFALIEE